MGRRWTQFFLLTKKIKSAGMFDTFSLAKKGDRYDVVVVDSKCLLMKRVSLVVKDVKEIVGPCFSLPSGKSFRQLLVEPVELSDTKVMTDILLDENEGMKRIIVYCGRLIGSISLSFTPYHPNIDKELEDYNRHIAEYHKVVDQIKHDYSDKINSVVQEMKPIEEQLEVLNDKEMQVRGDMDVEIYRHSTDMRNKITKYVRNINHKKVKLSSS
jgi:hypothetical protein